MWVRPKYQSTVQLAEDLRKPGAVPGPTAIRIICDLAARNVTILSVNGMWHSMSDAVDAIDIVMVYAGNGKYYKTEVGK